MEKISTLFGIKLEYQVFGVLNLYQKHYDKDRSFQEAIAAVNLAKSIYKRIWKEELIVFITE